MTTTDPHLEDRDEQPYVGIPIEASLSEWGQVNALVGELVAWLEDRDETLAGAPFYRYDVIGDDTDPFSLVVAIPTDRQISGDERVQAGAVPEGTYAVTIHEGHPDDLGESHAGLQEWAAEQGHELARSVDGDTDIWEGRYEHYLTDPDEEPDPTEWSTEIAYLVE
ncbi:AraC family transcriptional regulator (plasmid) [Salinigranum rubrum]|uniref:AraC family transcriptional regulator n=1 Tax=Salinigranum rubrum TaxID=755307 RepID=A0A2I8VQP5_9EURY|nr:GyrI-like domain-containing protein [Salinigranum rubrum]AUV84243.1 AraC family transcriptional regulator [Salinigranum rubrum]